MPANEGQGKIALVRQPSRDSVLPLLNEIDAIIKAKETTEADEYRRKLLTRKKTVDRLRVQLSTLDNQWISAMDNSLTTAEYATEYEMMSRYGRLVDTCEAKIENQFRILDKSESEPQQAPALLQEFTRMLNETRLNTTADDSQLQSVLQRLAVVQEQQTHHLPVLNVKKFNGDITYFYAWLDEFKVNIHDRPHMSDSQKFTYLRNLLEGSAKNTLDNFPLTGSNYNDALNYLIERYGNVETIAIEIVTQLMQMPKLEKIVDNQLRNYLDKINSYVVALKSMRLDEQHYSTILYPIILRKIPNQLSLRFIGQVDDRKEKAETTVRLIEQSRDSIDLAAIFTTKFKSLIAFLRRETESREQIGTIVNGAGGSHYQSQPATANGDSNASKSSAQPKKFSRGKVVLPTQGSDLKCPFCKEGHFPSRCKSTLPVDRKLMLLRKEGFCTSCLHHGHEDSKCTKSIKCYGCKGSHHRALCTNSVAQNVMCGEQSQMILPTGHLKLIGNSKSILARFLLDSAAERTFITAKCADQLGLETLGFESFYLHVFGESCSKLEKFRVVEIEVETSCRGRLKFKALVTSQITGKVPPMLQPDIRRRLQIPAERKSGPRELGILFNARDTMCIVEGGIKRISKNLSILNTLFGEIPIGEYNPRSLNIGQLSLLSSLEKFWSLDHLGILPSELHMESKVSEGFHDDFLKSIEFSGGMYSTVLNINHDKLEFLSDNLRMAKKQAESLMKSFREKPELGAEYVRQMNVFFENGFAEEVPHGEQPRYFMPHFPVINECKTTYKVRPVFNASSRMRGQLSINDVILDVPNLLPTSVEILLGFRKHNVGLVGDITKAYMTVGIQEKFRNYLCFLWSPRLDVNDLKVFRMNRNCFGVKDAQFNVIAVIRHHAQKFSESDPMAAHAVINELYMDDLISGGKSRAAVEELREGVYRILKKGGMIMKKWKISGTMGPEGEDRILASEAPEKVLGVIWNNVEDVLTFKSKDLEGFVRSAKPCKRTLMGAVARLHDPAGFISPFVMKVKLLLQRAHLAKIGLDAILPSDLLGDWEKWCDQLKFIDQFKIRRAYAQDLHTAESLQLHVFSDASGDGYAGVVYLRSQFREGKKPAISFVISKARLTPLKSLKALTIPKKELVAAMCAVRLATSAKKFLNLDCETYYWTDSSNVYYWIKSETPLKYDVFIRNRLIEILKLSSASEWHHVPGKLNPADYPSRGLMMQKLLDEDAWLNGPKFLSGGVFPISEHNAQEISISLSLAKNIIPFAELVDLQRFSTVRRAIRVTATVIRAIARFKLIGSLVGKRTRKARVAIGASIAVLGKIVSSQLLSVEPLTSVELTLAKHRLIRECQLRCFREAVLRQDTAEDLRLAAFDPFFDENLCLRVGGRLHNIDEGDGVKHPIILADDLFTILVIRDIHENRVAHLRTDLVLASLREEFWVLQARRLVKKLLNRCVTCKRHSAKAGSEIEAPLPGPRLEKGGVFGNVGVDYLGPFEIKDGKVWIALYTCSVTRGVHLEVAEDLSAGTFLNTLKRFVAARGVPQRIISDNALNFVRAAKALNALWSNLRSEVVQEYFGNRGFVWSHNVPRAAWWGGQFERLVRVVKDCLKKTSKLREQSLLQFVTIIKEIEAIINARPLTVLPDTPSAPTPLTPSNFLISNARITLPTGSIKAKGGKEDELVRLWREREKILNDFWTRWRSEYILMLRSAHMKSNRRSVPLAVNDIVLIQEESPNRALWRLGRVEELIIGKDGKSRTCKVRTATGYLMRTPQHLHKLM